MKRECASAMKREAARQLASSNNLLAELQGCRSVQFVNLKSMDFTWRSTPTAGQKEVRPSSWSVILYLPPDMLDGVYWCRRRLQDSWKTSLFYALCLSDIVWLKLLLRYSKILHSLTTVLHPDFIRLPSTYCAYVWPTSTIGMWIISFWSTLHEVHK